jgi:type I restriction enzyme M protein
MADEQSRPPFNKRSPIPKDFDWQSLLERDGDELETHYRHVLESLGKQKGMLGALAVNLENDAEQSTMPMEGSAAREDPAREDPPA